MRKNRCDDEKEDCVSEGEISLLGTEPEDLVELRAGFRSVFKLKQRRFWCLSFPGNENISSAGVFGEKNLKISKFQI